MANVDSALIAAGAALGGTALGIFGNAWLDRLKDHRAARGQRDQAVAEMLSATADLMTGIQTIRHAYDRSVLRGWLRTVVAVFAAIGTAFASEEKLTPGAVLDWRKSAPLLQGLLAIDRGLSEQQRTVALDLSAVLIPRTNRFFAAAAALTLGQDKELTSATRGLAEAVGALLEVTAANDRKYTRARTRADKALGGFRETADGRRR